MDFDFDKDMYIFNPVFEKRPEITEENLKKDLEGYYLPFVQKLIYRKLEKSPEDGFIVGVSAIQGAGKTTQGEILEIILKNFGYTSVSLSIDDHYITHLELCDLREKDPRFIRRGVTHDIALAIRDLKGLQNMGSEPILVSGYDKGAQDGDGDRFRWINPSPGLVVKARVIEKNLKVNKEFKKVKAIELVSAAYLNIPVFLPSNMGSDIPVISPFLPSGLVEAIEKLEDKEIIISEVDRERVKFAGEGFDELVDKKDLPNGWKLIIKAPDFIFYDGWMLGARSVDNESVFESGLPALDTPEHIQFAKDINNELLNYLPLWDLLEFLNILYVKDYQISLKWRDQAEERLRAKGGGMSSEEIREFVYYFWRSVHPAIHLKNLAEDRTNTDQVVVIDENHAIKEVFSPKEVK